MSARRRGPASGETSIDRLLAIEKLSIQTRQNYALRVRAYLRRTGRSPDEFVAQVRRSPKRFEEEFVRFLGEVSKKSATSTTAFWRDSLKRYLEINRVRGVDWEYVNQFVPKVTKSGQDRAPSLEEVRKVAIVADLRTKCLILLLASSGMRVGSVDYLHWKDFAELEWEGKRLAKVVVYAGEPEQYSTFVTPECYEYLSEYRRFRENLGEKVGPASPVFVQGVNKRDFDPKKVRAVGVRTLKNQLGELMNQMGMRAEIERKAKGKAGAPSYRSYEFKQAHGFRKFFKTRMELSGVKPIITEMLMGHEIGVSGSYMKPTDRELLEEYAKAIPNLTVLEKAASGTDLRKAFREQLLLVAGFGEEEIRKMDLSETDDERFQKMVRERLLGAMANNGSRQKVVQTAEEARSLIGQGWELAGTLPNGDVVVKLP